MAKQRYHSDVIRKRNKEADFETEESLPPRRWAKETPLSQSVSSLPVVKQGQDSITIEIKINLNPNQSVNMESIQRQIPKLVQSQKLIPSSSRAAPEQSLKLSSRSINSYKGKETERTVDSFRVEDLNLPEETEYCES